MVIQIFLRDAIGTKEAIYTSASVRIRGAICRAVSRSRDSGLRYNSPLSMEILNRTKQQYISQNYVILRARIHTVQYALGRAANRPWFLFAFFFHFVSFQFIHRRLIFSIAF